MLYKIDNFSNSAIEKVVALNLKSEKSNKYRFCNSWKSNKHLKEIKQRSKNYTKSEAKKIKSESNREKSNIAITIYYSLID